MRVLAVAKDAPTAFRGIVSGSPRWIPQEGAEPDEVVGIQVLLWATQRPELRRFGIRTPDLVPPLRFLRRLSVAQVVCPDCKPVFQEGASQLQFTASWTSQETGELRLFFRSQVLSPMEKQGAVQPQVFPGTTHLVPVVPGRWWRVEFGEQIWCSAHCGDRGRIGRRQLEPLVDRTVIDAELSSDGSSRRDFWRSRRTSAWGTGGRNEDGDDRLSSAVRRGHPSQTDQPAAKCPQAAAQVRSAPPASRCRRMNSRQLAMVSSQPGRLSRCWREF